MPLIKRTELTEQYLAASSRQNQQIFLLFGERYLIRKTIQTISSFITESTQATIHRIDETITDPTENLQKLQSFSLLPGKQLFVINDTTLFHNKKILPDLWQKAETAHKNKKTAQELKHLLAFVNAVGLTVENQTTLTELENAQWNALFGFDKPSSDLEWADTILFANRDVLNSQKANIAESYQKTFKKGLPAGNILILAAETVDKRHKLFKYIKENGVVVDCSVAMGSSSAAQTEQKDVIKEMMHQTLAEFGKKIDPRAVDLFLERVGFHPVAVVTESEKLAHFTGDKPNITMVDLEAMVPTNRENALFELTDALGKRQAAKTLITANNLIDQGVHSLAILATLKNFTRKLLIFKSIQLSLATPWNKGMSVKEFQNRYLPEIKAQGDWKELLGGHPYALYMNFTRAQEFSTRELKKRLTMLLAAEYQLKSSNLPQKLILENLLISMLRGTSGTGSS